MKDPITYRHPRSMVEAFGPYEGRGLYSKPEPMHRNDKIALAACALGLVALLAMLWLGWLPG